MSAGERAIAKEMKRQEQEKIRQMKLANKMLIPVSKKTELTLELTSFDPNGVFYLSENRWMKIFKMEGEINKLVSVVQNLTGRVRITLHMDGDCGRESCHLSLMETGEMYEDVRQKMIEDEAVLSKAVILYPLDIDEAMNQIAVNFLKDIRFLYASYVRGKYSRK